MVVPTTWQFKEIPNEAKQSPMQRLEANQMLNQACKNYAQSSLSILIIEHKIFDKDIYNTENCLHFVLPQRQG